jgi:hypothetical protein
MLSFFPLWLPVWLFSSFGLALLVVVHHHRRRRYLESHALLDEELSKQSPISAMRPSGNGVEQKQQRTKTRSAFRMGDYLLHILPLAVKMWVFDLPS